MPPKRPPPISTPASSSNTRRATRSQTNTHVAAPERLINDPNFGASRRPAWRRPRPRPRPRQRLPLTPRTPPGDPTSPIRRRLGFLPDYRGGGSGGLTPFERVVIGPMMQHFPEGILSRRDLVNLRSVSRNLHHHMNNRWHDYNRPRCDNMIRTEWTKDRYLPGPISRCPFGPQERGEVKLCRGADLGLDSADDHHGDFWVCEPCNRVAFNASLVEFYRLPLCRDCSIDFDTLYPGVALNHPKFDCDCKQQWDTEHLTLCNECRITLEVDISSIIQKNVLAFLPVEFPNVTTDFGQRLKKVYNEIQSGCWCGKSHAVKQNSYVVPGTMLTEWDASECVRICLVCLKQAWMSLAVERTE